MVRRLRIHLPMQGTWVRSLVWEDSTCHRPTKPVCHNYWTCSLEPRSPNYWACILEPVLCNQGSHYIEKPAHHNYSSPCSLQLEKAHAQQQRCSTVKINKYKFLKRNLKYFFLVLVEFQEAMELDVYISFTLLLGTPLFKIFKDFTIDCLQPKIQSYQ